MEKQDNKERFFIQQNLSKLQASWICPSNWSQAPSSFPSVEKTLHSWRPDGFTHLPDSRGRIWGAWSPLTDLHYKLVPISAPVMQFLIYHCPLYSMGVWFWSLGRYCTLNVNVSCFLFIDLHGAISICRDYRTICAVHDGVETWFIV